MLYLSNESKICIHKDIDVIILKNCAVKLTWFWYFLDQIIAADQLSLKCPITCSKMCSFIAVEILQCVLYRWFELCAYVAVQTMQIEKQIKI